MSDTNEVSKFLGSIAWTRYVGYRYAYAAVRVGTEFVNVVCEVTFEVNPADGDWSFKSDVDELVIRRGWIPIPDAKASLSGLEGGYITIDGDTLQFRSTTDSRPYGWSRDYQARGSTDDIGWATYKLRGGYGDNIIAQHRYSSLERRLAAAEPWPFADWNMLARFLGKSLYLSHGHSAHANIFVPAYARIASATSSIETGELAVDVEVAEPFLNDVSLVVSPINSGLAPKRHAVSESEEVSAGRRRAISQLPVGTGPIRVQLVFDGERIDEAVAGVPSLASRAYGAIDPSLAWLKRLLKEKPLKGDHAALTRGVVATLNLGGVPTVDYSQESLAHFPDFISCFGDRKVIVGECTTGSAEGAKVDQVAGVASRIGQQVSDSLNAISVDPIVCIPNDYSAIPRELLRRAAQLRVAIVGREKLEQLLDAVLRGEPRSVIYRILTEQNATLLLRS